MTSLIQFQRAEYARIKRTYPINSKERRLALADLATPVATMVKSRSAIRQHQTRAAMFREATAEVQQ